MVNDQTILEASVVVAVIVIDNVVVVALLVVADPIYVIFSCGP